MNLKVNCLILLTLFFSIATPRTIVAKDHSESIAAVNKKLDALVAQKANRVSVDQLLTREGYKVEYKQKKNSSYATKFYSEGLLVSRKHILIMQFDQANAITSYESTQGLIGP